MDIWNCENWKQTNTTPFQKSGLYFRVEDGVDPEVRRACLEFARYLRKKYVFPSRVAVYIKPTYHIRAANGEMVYGTCFRPAEKSDFSYIRISTGDYSEMVQNQGKDNALATLLHCIAEMLTHYYQWLNDFNELTEDEEESQADQCATEILNEYALTREHP